MVVTAILIAPIQLVGVRPRTACSRSNFSLLWREPVHARTTPVHEHPLNIGNPFAKPCKTIEPAPGMLTASASLSRLVIRLELTEVNYTNR